MSQIYRGYPPATFGAGPGVMFGGGAGIDARASLHEQQAHARLFGLGAVGLGVYAFAEHKTWAKVVAPLVLIASAWSWWRARSMLANLDRPSLPGVPLGKTDMQTALADGARVGLAGTPLETYANARVLGDESLAKIAAEQGGANPFGNVAGTADGFQSGTINGMGN